MGGWINGQRDGVWMSGKVLDVSHKQCLAYSRYLSNICWMDGWTHVDIRNAETQRSSPMLPSLSPGECGSQGKETWQASLRTQG